MEKISRLIDFTGKTALITGAGKGAGMDIARVFASAGADIAITYASHGDEANALAEELRAEGIKAETFKFNQADVNEAEPLIDAVIKAFGRLDILVNNAGIYPAQPMNKITESDWDAMLDTNTKGVFFLSRIAAKKMKETGGGSIVNISSINASNPAGNLVHYGISKAAVEMMTRCMAHECGPDVRVNCVAPGLIWAEGQEQWIPGWRESYSERAPLGRLVKAEEIGKACAFFASDLASAVTGQTLTVDCGVMLAPCYDNSLKDL